MMGDTTFTFPFYFLSINIIKEDVIAIIKEEDVIAKNIDNS